VCDQVSQHLHITLKSDPTKFQYWYSLGSNLALKTPLVWLTHICWNCLNIGLYLFSFWFCIVLDAASFQIVQGKLDS
jgi:hypothetical protein